MAQTSRAEEARAARETKTQALEPYRKSRVEAALFAIEDDLLIERLLSPPRGFHVRLGGLGEGAGFGLGPGFRHNTPGVDVRAAAAVSFKRYVLAEAAVRFPGTLTDTLYTWRDGPYVELYARRRDFPQEDFYGIGPDTSEAARSNFALRESFARVTGGVRRGLFTAAAGVGYLDPSVGAGTDDDMPSTTEAFDPDDVPGLAAQPSFVVMEPFVEWASMNPALNDMSGGRYRLSFSRYHDLDLQQFSFSRWELDVRHYVAFFGASRTIALRGRLTSSVASDGQQVPFYLQPTLGGANTLRGFRTFRFRDDSALLLQAEYRWRINELVTGALFCDAGAVAPRLSGLGTLERDCGFGLRAGTRTGVVFRLDAAFGGEGPRLLLRFEDVF
ncbi:MAG TPA: BamA/TamA family outer membrane protein [Vicinamibacterales bacterium]|nr:BamA/TamA family outer membrane protein [Vicinamibacterales bacterium]